jgi:hypothetical protein
MEFGLRFGFSCFFVRFLDASKRQTPYHPYPPTLLPLHCGDSVSRILKNLRKSAESWLYNLRNFFYSLLGMTGKRHPQ